MISMGGGNPLRKMMEGGRSPRGGRPLGTQDGMGYNPQPTNPITPQFSDIMQSPQAKGVLGGLMGGMKMPNTMGQQAAPNMQPPMIQNLEKLSGSPRRRMPEPGLGGIGLPSIAPGENFDPSLGKVDPNRNWGTIQGGTQVGSYGQPQGGQAPGTQPPKKQVPQQMPPWYKGGMQGISSRGGGGYFGGGR